MEYLKDGEKFNEWLVKSQGLDHLPHKYILKNHQCPGDLLMLTACVRDIKIWYPNVQLDVDTSDKNIWLNNPNLTHLDEKDPDVTKLDMQYEIIHKSNENFWVHFIHGFIDDFNKKTGFSVKLTNFRADVYLTEEEKKKPVFDDQPERFVVLVAGGKDDYQSKWWWKDAWTKVIKGCPKVKFIQIGKKAKDHHHDVIETDNCMNKLGETSIRDVLRLVFQSVGTLSVVTSVMHMARAFDKHAAIVAGGHEPWWWEKYPGHDYFHTIGRLSCCKFGGCWKGKCENKNDKDRQRCLELIDPDEVAHAIRRWFK